MIPRHKHSVPASIQAKENELKQFTDYDVYDIVERPENYKIIRTQWVIVNKEFSSQKEVVRKAMLCKHGNQEKKRDLFRKILLQ